MRYRPQSKDERTIPLRGDVCLMKETLLGRTAGYYAAIVSVSGDSLEIKRLWKTDPNGTRHLLYDAAPTGLEYAVFMDPEAFIVRKSDLVRILGRISKRDRNYL